MGLHRTGTGKCRGVGGGWWGWECLKSGILPQAKHKQNVRMDVYSVDYENTRQAFLSKFATSMNIPGDFCFL